MAKVESKYKGVHYQMCNSGRNRQKPWRAQLTYKQKAYSNYHATEREAAIAHDLQRIKVGLEPVNILKPKTK